MSQIKRKSGQIARTRALIEDAFLTAIESGTEMGQITVTTLCKRAGVGRQTFYRHYTSVSDVLASLLKQTRDTYILELRKLEPAAVDLRTINLKALQVVHQYKRIMSLARYADMRPVYSDLFDEIFKDLAITYPLYHDLDPMIKSFRLWGFKGVFFEWVDQGMGQSPEDLSDLIMEWTVNVKPKG